MPSGASTFSHSSMLPRCPGANPYRLGISVRTSIVESLSRFPAPRHSRAAPSGRAPAGAGGRGEARVEAAVLRAADALDVEAALGARARARGQAAFGPQRLDLPEGAGKTLVVEVSQHDADAVALDHLVHVAYPRVADDGEA